MSKSFETAWWELVVAGSSVEPWSPSLAREIVRKRALELEEEGLCEFPAALRKIPDSSFEDAKTLREFVPMDLLTKKRLNGAGPR